MNNEHQIAIQNLYQSHGVGDTNEQKLNFWKSRHPEGYNLSHELSLESEIGLMELSWLADKFPNDF